MILNDLLKTAKIASKNADVPFYSRYVYFDGDSLVTCNGRTFCKIKYPSSINGSVNIFVLSDVLNKMNDPHIEQNGCELIVYEGSYDTRVSVEEISIPNVPLPDYEFYKVDEDTYNSVKQALKYTKAKDNVHCNVGVSINGIYSSDRHHRVFRSYDSLSGIEGPILINHEIFKAVFPGCSVYPYEGNMFVSWEGGYCAFTLDSMSVFDRFPYDLIEKMTDKTAGQVFLCNVAGLLEAVEVVSPILTGEMIKQVTLKNKLCKMVVSASSETNGRSDVIIDTEIEDKFKTTVDITAFKDVSYDYDVFIDKSTTDLYLHNDTSSLTLLGV